MDTIMENVRTAGAYVLYNGLFVFQVGPTKNGGKLGVVRLGGHSEAGESPLETAEREVMEEAAMQINLVDSPVTYLLNNWDETGSIIQPMEKINPILIKGNQEEGFTVMYISFAESKPKPSSESKGILLLSPKEIEFICNHRITLNGLMQQSGQAILTEGFNKELILKPFPQLLFLSKLLKQEPGYMKALL
ncbi:NUDIX hydrolase [Oceanobacillus neutriphilus]|uniref:DNA mismatch repair protein MutT n=1 Tax=Oceanobacillus neutriphilus TaxID=531815 RepID=A0ABQ2NVT7_9BACI|nr:NUDIX domain-containing protein [Oceanobacillus neutriphilus]GGP11816.1 DNA mismatch repair protein MutT [Oceanobacillus neutriphilus]